MTLNDTLNNEFPNQFRSPKTLAEIPKDVYMVYILAFDDKPIVLGKGKKYRAKIILVYISGISSITISHCCPQLPKLQNRNK